MCHNTQNNGIQHNDTKHKASFNNVTMVMILSKTSLILKLRNNDTQHDDIRCDDSQHNWLNCDNIEDTQDIHLQHLQLSAYAAPSIFNTQHIYTCIMTLSIHT